MNLTVQADNNNKEKCTFSCLWAQRVVANVFEHDYHN